MSIDLRTLPVMPAGFGRCARCAYLQSGPASVCYACARQTMESLSFDRCMTCDRPFLNDEEECRNPVCNWEDRYFEMNYAIAMKTGMLDRVLHRYKYDDIKAWAIIFRRVLYGYLEDAGDEFDEFDLLIPSPTYVGDEEGARSWDHTAEILDFESEEAAALPVPVRVTPPVIVKTSPTTRFVGRGWKERYRIAVQEIRPALTVTDRAAVEGKKILVFDDVFTDGLNLNEVARALRLRGGATEVCGLTLMRTKFRGR